MAHHRLSIRWVIFVSDKVHTRLDSRVSDNDRPRRCSGSPDTACDARGSYFQPPLVDTRSGCGVGFLRPSRDATRPWAINSTAECYLHTVEVTGSNPVSPRRKASACRTRHQGLYLQLACVRPLVRYASTWRVVNFRSRLISSLVVEKLRLSGYAAPVEFS